MFESCLQIRENFSDYLEGQCTPEMLRSIRYHLNYCPVCGDELELTEMLHADLRALPRRRVPPELDLRVRVRLSQELHGNLLERLLVRFENALQPLLLPASAGVLTAIICFGLIMGSGAVPTTKIPDVPLQFSTPPRIRTLAPMDFPIGDQGVVVVTHIAADGQVLDYKVLSGQNSPEMLQHLDRIIYFSVFQPATMFGKPTNGHMVLSLRRITVRG
jgi:hypothetical protein